MRPIQPGNTVVVVRARHRGKPRLGDVGHVLAVGPAHAEVEVTRDARGHRRWSPGRWVPLRWLRRRPR